MKPMIATGNRRAKKRGHWLAALAAAGLLTLGAGSASAGNELADAFEDTFGRLLAVEALNAGRFLLTGYYAPPVPVVVATTVERHYVRPTVVHEHRYVRPHHRHHGHYRHGEHYRYGHAKHFRRGPHDRYHRGPRVHVEREVHRENRRGKRVHRRVVRERY